MGFLVGDDVDRDRWMAQWEPLDPSAARGYEQAILALSAAGRPWASADGPLSLPADGGLQ